MRAAAAACWPAVLWLRRLTGRPRDDLEDDEGDDGEVMASTCCRCCLPSRCLTCRGAKRQGRTERIQRDARREQAARDAGWAEQTAAAAVPPHGGLRVPMAGAINCCVEGMRGECGPNQGLFVLNASCVILATAMAGC
jgi:hypothetical protein